MKFLVQAVVCVLAAAAATWANAAQQPTVNATWHMQEARFIYTGFTTNYTCDGLERQLKLLLRLAGARPDAVVLTIYTLSPAAAADAKAATAGVWKDMAWRAGLPRELDAGDCELVDEFARRILPLFTTRSVENGMTCTPGQVNPSGFDLRFSVLAPSDQSR